MDIQNIIRIFAQIKVMVTKYITYYIITGMIFMGLADLNIIIWKGELIDEETGEPITYDNWVRIVNILLWPFVIIYVIRTWNK